MAVPVATSGSFTAGAPLALFDAATGEAAPTGTRNFNIPAPDGSKVRLLTHSRTAKSNALHVVLDWMAEPVRKSSRSAPPS